MPFILAQKLPPEAPALCPLEKLCVSQSACRMISWTDDATILMSRPFGETSAVVEVFTPDHGRCVGVVRGGASRKKAAMLQAGSQVSVTWKARLNEHMGSMTVEPVRSRAAQSMSDRLALAGLNAVCALLSRALPEREPHEPLYHRTIQLLDLLGQSEVWPLAYLRWEQALLEELGFGMDLSACAVRGVNEDLAFVSPKSGRAVSREAAGDWADRLLPLPPVLAGKGDADNAQIGIALRTTGYFIEKRLLTSLGDRPAPAARQRLLDAISRHGT